MSTPQQSSVTRPFLHGMALRLSGPGGLYNFGNIIALGSGAGFALQSALTRDEALPQALTAHFLGNPGSKALTIAIAMFIIGGEAYHRAWHYPPASQKHLDQVRRGDVWSGFASLILAVSLVWFGDLWLALTSSVLLAGGKFGNALWPQDGFPIRVEAKLPGLSTLGLETDGFRSAVILSRIPAMLALAVGAAQSAMSGTAHTVTWQSLILLACYGLWLAADICLARRM